MEKGISNVTIVQNEAEGTFGWVGFSKKDRQIVVSFRGSVNAKNWETNNNYNLT